jgi:hypothetical protein
MTAAATTEHHPSWPNQAHLDDGPRCQYGAGVPGIMHHGGTQLVKGPLVVTQPAPKAEAPHVRETRARTSSQWQWQQRRQARRVLGAGLQKCVCSNANTEQCTLLMIFALYQAVRNLPQERDT